MSRPDWKPQDECPPENQMKTATQKPENFAGK